MKAELSTRNRWHIPKERYYELLHFCRQYPTWKAAAERFDSLSKKPADILSKGTGIGDPTVRCVLARDYYLTKIQMVDTSAVESAGNLNEILKEGVIFGRCYEVLQARHPELLVSRDEYYIMYRKFFSVLSDKRD